jgi:hypothetical protein
MTPNHPTPYSNVEKLRVRAQELVEKLGGDIRLLDWNNQKTTRLETLWYTYYKHLNKILKRAKGQTNFMDIGFPVTYFDDGPRLRWINFGINKIPREWFMDKPKGDTVVSWKAVRSGIPDRPEPPDWCMNEYGYGDWFHVLSWTWKENLLTIYISDWYIQTDREHKRINLIFMRYYTITENDPAFKEDLENFVTYSVNLDKVPSTHIKKARWAFKHQTSLANIDESQWVTLMRPIGFFHELDALQEAAKVYDDSILEKFFVYRQFKNEWFDRYLDAFWNTEDTPYHERWKRRHITEDGLLKRFWFMPNTSNPSDAVHFNEVKEQWDRVRQAYEWWRRKFTEVLQGKKPDLSGPPGFPEFPLDPEP